MCISGVFINLKYLTNHFKNKLMNSVDQNMINFFCKINLKFNKFSYYKFTYEHLLVEIFVPACLVTKCILRTFTLNRLI